jgi:hypothetical protein
VRVSATKPAISARNKLWNEIWAGRIKRADTCENCGKKPGDKSLIHAHHDDYSKPLDVRWLCASCHKRHHVKFGPAKLPADFVEGREPA